MIAPLHNSLAPLDLLVVSQAMTPLVYSSQANPNWLGKFLLWICLSWFGCWVFSHTTHMIGWIRFFCGLTSLGKCFSHNGNQNSCDKTALAVIMAVQDYTLTIWKCHNSQCYSYTQWIRLRQSWHHFYVRPECQHQGTTRKIIQTYTMLWLNCHWLVDFLKVVLSSVGDCTIVGTLVQGHYCMLAQVCLFSQVHKVLGHSCQPVLQSESWGCSCCRLGTGVVIIVLQYVWGQY